MIIVIIIIIIILISEGASKDPKYGHLDKRPVYLVVIVII